MTKPLDWLHEIAAIGGGHHESRKASPAEREAIARALDIVSCEELAAAYDITPIGNGRFLMRGEIEAALTQACVATLDPVPARIVERFSVELWPELAGHPDDHQQDDREVLSGTDVEPIEGGRIDAGRIIFEHLSAALDPYPRKPGAEFSWRDPKAEADAAAGGAFAALAKLKQPK